MLDANLPFINIKHENFLPHDCTTHQDAIPLLRISSKTIVVDLVAVQVLTRKPVVIK
jgi:hypothetical protein